MLYRWGNPQNYRRGDSTDRQLFRQHDVRWVEKDKPGEGNLTIFNNDNPYKDSLNYSSVVEISPASYVKAAARLRCFDSESRQRSCSMPHTVDSKQPPPQGGGVCWRLKVAGCG